TGNGRGWRPATSARAVWQGTTWRAAQRPASTLVQRREQDQAERRAHRCDRTADGAPACRPDGRVQRLWPARREGAPALRRVRRAGPTASATRVVALHRHRPRGLLEGRDRAPAALRRLAGPAGQLPEALRPVRASRWALVQPQEAEGQRWPRAGGDAGAWLHGHDLFAWPRWLP